MKISYLTTLLFGVLLTTQVCSQSTAAEYPLDGDALDSGGAELHGIVHGAVPVTDRFGNASSALSFDGEDDYIEVPYVAPFNFGVQDFAISVWIKVPRPDRSSGGSIGPGMIVNKGGESGVWRPAYWLRAPDLYDDNHIAWFTGNAQPGAPYAADDQIILDDGEWHHIVAQRVGAVIELYVDGVLLDTDSSYIRNVNDPNGLLIGAQNPNPDRPYIHHHFFGYIDDLSFFNESLTQEQIDDLGDIELSVSTTISSEEIEIYPNPVDSKLHIEGDYETIQVFDVRGKLVFEKQYVGNSVILSSLDEGLYFVKFSTQQKTIVSHRLVVRN